MFRICILNKWGSNNGEEIDLDNYLFENLENIQPDEWVESCLYKR